MDRREFLEKALGLTVVSAVTPAVLTCACNAFARSAPLSFAPIIINMNDAKYAALQTINGSVRILTPAVLIITRVSDTEFSTVDGLCTHEQNLLRRYDADKQLITCTAHNSTFDVYGKIIFQQVPNQPSLRRYKTTFDGNNILTIEDALADVKMEALLVTRIDRIYPNPFSTRTSISLSVKESIAIDLSIFDLDGNNLATVFAGPLDPGEHSFPFDGSALAAGSYFCRLTTEAGSVVRQIHIVR